MAATAESSILAADLVSALDPVHFAVMLGLEPDPWQAAVLRSFSQRLLLNCSRLSGKSTITAILALHYALYHPGSLTLLLSPSLRQSQELFRKVLTFYRALANPVPANAENALSLQLASGSRVVSLPGKEQTVRGFSDVGLLVIDEAARVQNDLYVSVRPMLAISGGRLIALSTPFGTRGWYYDAWANGGERWERVEVPAWDCPRIDPAFLEEERRALGSWWFEQEYGCQFQEAATHAFTRIDVDRAFSEGITPWVL